MTNIANSIDNSKSICGKVLTDQYLQKKPKCLEAVVTLLNEGKSPEHIGRAAAGVSPGLGADFLAIATYLVRERA